MPFFGPSPERRDGEGRAVLDDHRPVGDAAAEVEVLEPCGAERIGRRDHALAALALGDRVVDDAERDVGVGERLAGRVGDVDARRLRAGSSGPPSPRPRGRPRPCRARLRHDRRREGRLRRRAGRRRRAGPPRRSSADRRMPRGHLCARVRGALRAGVGRHEHARGEGDRAERGQELTLHRRPLPSRATPRTSCRSSRRPRSRSGTSCTLHASAHRPSLPGLSRPSRRSTGALSSASPSSSSSSSGSLSGGLGGLLRRRPWAPRRGRPSRGTRARRPPPSDDAARATRRSGVSTSFSSPRYVCESWSKSSSSSFPSARSFSRSLRARTSIFLREASASTACAVASRASSSGESAASPLRIAQARPEQRDDAEQHARGQHQDREAACPASRRSRARGSPSPAEGRSPPRARCGARRAPPSRRDASRPRPCLPLRQPSRSLSSASIRSS